MFDMIDLEFVLKKLGWKQHYFVQWNSDNSTSDNLKSQTKLPG